MISAKNVAEFFLCQIDEEVGENITNLKLQKLVYYAQGFSLAINNVALFEDPILAWEHGPVVESLYHEYKQYGKACALPIPYMADFSCFDSKQVELLDEVYSVFGQFSPWKLRDMTHSERPWLETPKNGVIDLNLMKEFFKTQLLVQ